MSYVHHQHLWLLWEAPVAGDTFETVTLVLVGVTSVLEAFAEVLPIGTVTGVTLLLEAFGETLPINVGVVTHPAPAEALGEALPINVGVVTHPAPTEAFGEAATNVLGGVTTIINETAAEVVGFTNIGVLSTLDAAAETLPVNALTGVHTLGSEALAEAVAVLIASGVLAADEALAETLQNLLLIVRFDQTTDDAPPPPGGTIQGSWWRMRRRRMA